MCRLILQSARHGKCCMGDNELHYALCVGLIHRVVLFCCPFLFNVCSSSDGSSAQMPSFLGNTATISILRLKVQEIFLSSWITR
jgi:hypothetical protein